MPELSIEPHCSDEQIIMSNSYNIDLDPYPTNNQLLSPLTCLARMASVFSKTHGDKSRKDSLELISHFTLHYARIKNP